MRVGIPSDDDRFRRLYTFMNWTHLDVSFFTHRYAIPKKDDVLLALLDEWSDRFDAIVIPLTFCFFGSLRVAELVHRNDIHLGVVLCSASANLSKKLAMLFSMPT